MRVSSQLGAFSRPQSFEQSAWVVGTGLWPWPAHPIVLLVLHTWLECGSATWKSARVQNWASALQVFAASLSRGCLQLWGCRQSSSSASQEDSRDRLLLFYLSTCYLVPECLLQRMGGLIQRGSLSL